MAGKRVNISDIKSRKQLESLRKQGATFITGSPEKPPKRKNRKKK